MAAPGMVGGGAGGIPGQQVKGATVKLLPVQLEPSEERNANGTRARQRSGCLWDADLQRTSPMGGDLRSNKCSGAFEFLGRGRNISLVEDEDVAGLS